jgi:hypothetical protein
MLYTPRGWRQAMQWLLALALVSGVVFLALNFRNYNSQQLWRFGGALGVLALLVAYNFLAPAISAWRLWSALPRGMSIRGKASVQGITFQHGAAGRFLEWKQFVRVRRAKDLAVLASQGNLIAVLPRGFFKTEKDWARFDQWVEKCARQPQVK